VSLLGRTKTFKVWLVDRGNVERAHYHAAALPGVGETIFVRKTELDDDGQWQTMKVKPVPARVTRVRGGVITAVNIDGDYEDAVDAVNMIVERGSAVDDAAPWAAGRNEAER